MRTTGTAFRSGLAAGLIELRQSFTGTALVGQLLWPGLTLGAMFFLRNREFGASGFTVGTLMLPGLLGAFASLGMVLVLQNLAADREDGALLRAKATPNGVVGYLVSKLVLASLTILVYLVMVLAGGLVMLGGVHVLDFTWPRLAWVLGLGLVATQLIGAVLGSLISSTRGVGYVSLPVMGLIGVSGIFYPIIALPDWLQWTAQVFPVYWLGLGMRSALLPEHASVVEIGESWRHAETVAVLGGWAVLGLLVAPVVLSRMARRESGSRVAERRDKVLQRVA